MAAPTARRQILSTALASTVGLWLLAAILFAARWSSVARMGYPQPDLFPYGHLRVGVDASYPPFAVAASDELYGLDIDLARLLGEYFTVDVHFVNLGYDGLYDALLTDQVDVLISAVIPDPTRTDRIRYTLPYFNAGLVLISEPETHIDEMRDLTGARLSFQYGSQAQSEAERWLRRIGHFMILPYETPQIALDAVRVGEADAALVEAVAARLYLRQYPAWPAQVHTVTVVPYAVAILNNRGRLAAAVDDALRYLLQSGKIDALIQRHL